MGKPSKRDPVSGGAGGYEVQVGLLDYDQISLDRQRDRERDAEMLGTGLIGRREVQRRNSLVRPHGPVTILALPEYCTEDEDAEAGDEF